jgi:hypothetical protein
MLISILNLNLIGVYATIASHMMRQTVESGESMEKQRKHGEK